MRDYFKSISIAGRMAFGIHCLEAALLQYKYDGPLIQLLLARLRNFIERSDLALWDAEAGEMAPYCVLDDHPQNSYADYETLTVAQLTSLKTLYEQMPVALCDLIDHVIDIGRSNIYGGVGEYSEFSLREVENVIQSMSELNVALPATSPYSISPFAENGGWGYIRPLADFRKTTG